MGAVLKLYPKKQDILVAALTAIAIAIHVVESSIPNILPGIKPGLSNVITLICFFSFGLKVAIQVNLLRVFIASLIIGSFLSPTFILSLSGAVSSLLTLVLFSLFISPKVNYKNTAIVGPIGIAIASSVSHMLGQFYMAWFFYIPHPQLFSILPVLIIMSIIMGITSGVITLFVLKSRIFISVKPQY